MLSSAAPPTHQRDLPFYPYARQDKKHRGREPISARLIADLLKTAGADRIITVDLHTDQIQGFFDGPVDHMHALGQLAEYVRNNYGTDNVCVVSPDAGRVKVGEEVGRRAQRRADGVRAQDPRPSTTRSRPTGWSVTSPGKTCVLIGDMIDTGGTIAGAVNVLKEAGAGDVIIATTHGVFSHPAAERLANCGAKEVIATDTLPIPEDKRFENLTVLIAPLLAQTIQEVFENGSVTSTCSTAA